MLLPSLTVSTVANNSLPKFNELLWPSVHPFINHSENLDHRSGLPGGLPLQQRPYKKELRNDVPKQVGESCRKLLSGSRVPVSWCREMG